MSDNKSNSRISDSIPRSGNDVFWSVLIGIASTYLLLIVAMIVANFQFSSFADMLKLLSKPRFRYSIQLSLISSTISAIIAMWFAVPTGYWLARFDDEIRQSNFRRRLRDAIIVVLDIPIVLPPIVVGISLLVLFQTSLGRAINDLCSSIFTMFGYEGISGVTYEIPAVVLAQFTVVTAFAIRTMRRCYEQIDRRPEKIAATLGASDYQVFSRISFPQSRGGMLAAFTLAWARALGEFGPILIFAGTTKMKTEVLPTSIYLSFQSGDLTSAVSASIILVTVAFVVLLVVRFWTSETTIA